MDQSIFKKIILKLKKENIKYVFLCGLGEPLLHPKIIEFVDFSIKNNIKPKLVTNGLLLNEDMQNKLINSGLRDFHLSIPSINKSVYEKINRGITFKKVMNNLETLMKKKNINIMLNIVVSKLNEDSINELVNFCRKKNLNWNFLEVTNRSISDFNKELMTNNPHLEKRKSSKGFCPISKTLIYIGFTGNVYLCCNDINKKYKICDFINCSYQKIIELREYYLQCGTDLCKNCIIFPINCRKNM